MRHNFEENKQRRIDNAKAKAAKNDRLSQEYYQRSHDLSSHIPMGQPILVGHHSEKRHRRDLDKINKEMRKSVQATDKADYYRDKAQAIANNDAIYADDPNAMDKITKKLDVLEKLQQFMKVANACIRKGDKEKFLKLEGATEALWVEINTPDHCKRVGYPSYKLSNNNAQIRRLKNRITELEGEAKRTTNEVVLNAIRLVENVELNRVQLIFPHKPVKQVRKELGKNGFHWYQENLAWQRLLNKQAVWVATSLQEKYAAITTGLYEND